MALITPIDLDQRVSLSPQDDGIAMQWEEIANSFEITGLLALVRQNFGASAAFISILGQNFQWFLAADGIDPVTSPVSDSVCRSVLYDRSLASVSDLSDDPVLAGNPFVAGETGLRAYAGIRLRIESGQPGVSDYGAFCIADHAPRDFDEGDIARLRQFAAIAKALITARLAEGRAARIEAAHSQLIEASERKDQLFRQTERMIAMGSWRMDLGSQAIEWSPGVYAIHALTPDTAPALGDAIGYYSEPDQAILQSAIASCSLDGTPFDLELDFTAADGQRKRVRAVGELELCNGRPASLIGMFQDISARYRIENGLRDQAFTDPLTGIANRAALQHHLADLFARAPQPGDIAAVLIDLDGFKAVNDRLGHARGDEILRTVAIALQACVTDRAMLARYGGDEFVIVVSDDNAEARAAAYAEAVGQIIRYEIDSDRGPIIVGASAGMAVNRDGDGPIDLLRRADDAMYERKTQAG
jgi:diguanylate cyclase (GGDEF)-like protein